MKFIRVFYFISIIDISCNLSDSGSRNENFQSIDTITNSNDSTKYTHSDYDYEVDNSDQMKSDSDFGISAFKDLLSREFVQKQIFKVVPGKRLTIKGKFGTEIFLESDCISSTHGLCDLVLVEYLTISDMLLSGLNTNSFEKRLRTGGMVYIDIRNSFGLSIKTTSTRYSVKIPSRIVDKEMKLFEGEIKDDLNWIPSKSKLKTEGVKTKIFDLGDTLEVDSEPGAPDLFYIDKVTKYVFDTYTLGYFNIDKELRAKGLGGIVINCSQFPKWARASIVDRENLSIYSFNCFGDGDFRIENLELEKKVSLVVIGVMKEFLYYSVQDILVNSASVKVEINDLQKVELQSLKSLLNAKFGMSI